MGIKIGRPSKYVEEEILRKTEEYINSCEDEQYTLVKTEGDKTTTWENKVRVNLPTYEGLCLKLDINKDTIREWRKTYQKFSVLIDKLLAKQANMLAKNGLSGDYNPTIAKVLLAKHGYRDSQDIDITTKGEPINGMRIMKDNGDNISNKEREAD